MKEYEQTQAVTATPGEVFAWLSEVANLPKYLPPVVGASVEGPSAQGTPGQRIRTTLEYPEGGGTFDAEGYLAVNEGQRRMEWGAEVERDYSPAEGVSATLESIRRQIEEGSGKVEPPPGAAPQTDENPAVVDDNPPQR